MRKLLVLLPLVAVIAGCAGQASVIRELAKDPATVHVQITSVWANIVYDRNNNTVTNK